MKLGARPAAIMLQMPTEPDKSIVCSCVVESCPLRLSSAAMHALSVTHSHPFTVPDKTTHLYVNLKDACMSTILMHSGSNAISANCSGHERQLLAVPA